jgi:K+-sensing histidine kinase KdpD
VTLQKKILAPVGPDGRNLKGVRYAMALAQRLGARVYILQLSSRVDAVGSDSVLLEKTLKEVINSARQAGLTISHHVAYQDFKNEIIDLIKQEGIDVLVFGADDERCERLLKRVRPLVPSQIIEVREKDHVNYL